MDLRLATFVPYNDVRSCFGGDFHQSSCHLCGDAFAFMRRNGEIGDFHAVVFGRRLEPTTTDAPVIHNREVSQPRGLVTGRAEYWRWCNRTNVLTSKASAYASSIHWVAPPFRVVGDTRKTVAHDLRTRSFSAAATSRSDLLWSRWYVQATTFLVQSLYKFPQYAL